MLITVEVVVPVAIALQRVLQSHLAHLLQSQSVMGEPPELLDQILFLVPSLQLVEARVVL
jgi:hypothetical protein